MTHSHRLPIATLFSACALLLPAAASALTVDELQTQIKTLLQQLQGLQQQLKDTRLASSTPNMASSTPDGHPCLELARTLSQGMRGDDVRALQRRLLESGDLSDDSAVTGLFGPKTAAAVHKMQRRFGIASSTGIVGPTTRDRLKGDCARKLMREMSDDRGPSTTTPTDLKPKDERSGEMQGEVRRGMWLGSSTMPMLRPKDDNKDKGQRGDMGGIGSGTIAQIGATSITVDTASGATKTVNIVDSTVIKFFSTSTMQMLTGTLSSLSVGDHVIVHGAAQADGTINAVLIQRMPEMPLMQRPPMPMNAGTSSRGRPPMSDMMFGGDGLDH